MLPSAGGDFEASLLSQASQAWPGLASSASGEVSSASRAE